MIGAGGAARSPSELADPAASPDVAAAADDAAEEHAERSVFGLAAELKNLIREDRIRRSKRG